LTTQPVYTILHMHIEHTCYDFIPDRHFSVKHFLILVPYSLYRNIPICTYITVVSIAKHELIVNMNYLE